MRLIVVNSFNRKSVTPIQVSAFFPTFSYEYSYGIAPSRGRFILNIMTTNFQTLKNLKLQFYQYTTTSWSSEYVHNCFPHFLLSKFLQVNTQKRPESILSNISSIAQMFKIRPLKWLLVLMQLELFIFIFVKLAPSNACFFLVDCP